MEVICRTGTSWAYLLETEPGLVPGFVVYAFSGAYFCGIGSRYPYFSRSGRSLVPASTPKRRAVQLRIVHRQDNLDAGGTIIIDMPDGFVPPFHESRTQCGCFRVEPRFARDFFVSRVNDERSQNQNLGQRLHGV